ncbi:glutamyl-tRNA reductase [Agarivorans gilvus]|uniref:Glutamyl-tRNA reductase n=1 Tax=Agarivorans gilvus TaxID=680279 RepID=A0ABQ1HXZ3_9ALTE|nr:glutamyl-tRNA reductase [Agarivorans gilvus]GGA97955.1 glutamyl-tRNA reductase [Agarivorans gilvus]
MSLQVLGINHKSAPLGLREKVAFSPEQVNQALTDASNKLGVEMVIVSTCNRTELYCNLGDTDVEKVVQWLVDYKNLPEQELRPSLYQYQQQQAVAHLMRVASGLDSLILGEPQILGQIKQAYTESREAGSVGSVLERFFQRAFSVAKQVRTDTDIGVNAVSVAFAAVSLAKQIFDDLRQSSVLLVGAGETIDLVAKHLADQGVQKMTVANRTVSRAKNLASRFGAEAITLNEIPEHLPQSDIVISSTASPLPIIGKGMVESALKKRRFQPMFLVDIAVPRDIEEQVGELRDAYLYSVDDLQGIVEQNMASRREAAEQAEFIVNQHSEDFMAWLRSLESVTTIRDYRSHSERVRDAAVEKALEALANGKDPATVVRETAFQLTNKLIHAPTEAINKAGRDGRLEELAVIREAIGLRK